MDVFVARQPIFDSKQNVVAYELLYRNNNTNSFSPGTDGDMATSDVLTNGLMLIGLDNMVGDKRAFINFTERLILEKVPVLFPKELLVVEVLETIEPTQEIIEACRELKSMGYIIALDDFVFDYKYQTLIDAADIIKVDFMLTQGPERERVISRIGSKKVKFLAEKVETQEEFEEAARLGYSYFQGYFFSKPVILKGKDISSTNISQLKLLEELNKKEPDFDVLANMIERDISISYKLLKYINYKGQYLISRISSIKHALMILGIKEIKKWIVLITMRGLGESKPDIIIRTCMIRAKLCEQLTSVGSMANRSAEAFIMGMFSMMDLLTDRPLGDVLKELPISEDVKRALLGEQGTMKTILDLAIAYEKGAWDIVHGLTAAIGIKPDSILRLYLNALQWVEEIYKLDKE